jgi:hypothetical protein
MSETDLSEPPEGYCWIEVTTAGAEQKSFIQVRHEDAASHVALHAKLDTLLELQTSQAEILVSLSEALSAMSDELELLAKDAEPEEVRDLEGTVHGVERDPDEPL